MKTLNSQTKHVNHTIFLYLPDTAGKGQLAYSILYFIIGKCLHEINVTGSGKRDMFAHIMIFLYKRCSKTRNIFYSLKKIFLA